MEPESPNVGLVGHCGPDMQMLKAAVLRAAPGATVASADDGPSLERHLAGKSLLLINRVLEGGFAITSGIELIGQLAQRDYPPAMMLISNFEDAQDAAVAAGARRGFGKAHLYNDATMAKLREALNPAPRR